jgi:hypothetical protein
MIKLFVPAMLVASALAVPMLALAQDDPGPTRAEVRTQLIQAEQAGYNPSANDVNYPSNIQAADARIAAKNGDNGTSYGPSTAGTSASGLHAYTPLDSVGTGSLYAHH